MKFESSLILDFAMPTKPGSLGQSRRKIWERNKFDFENQGEMNLIVL